MTGPWRFLLPARHGCRFVVEREPKDPVPAASIPPCGGYCLNRPGKKAYRRKSARYRTRAGKRRKTTGKAMSDRTGNQIADCVMSIAGSRTLAQLGAACHHAAGALTG